MSVSAAVIVQHEPLARAHVAKWCRLYGFARPHWDDLLQEARLGLCYAARRYDPAQSKFNITFGTYAHVWIDALLLRALKRLGPVHIGNTRPVGLAASMGREEFDPEKHGDATDARESAFDVGRLLSEFCSVAANALRRPYRSQKGQRSGINHRKVDRDVEMFLRWMAGESLESIGRSESISREAVRQRLLRVRAVFEEWAQEVRTEV